MPASNSFTLDLEAEEALLPQDQAELRSEAASETPGAFELDLSTEEDESVEVLELEAEGPELDLGPETPEGVFRQGLESEVSRLGSLGDLGAFVVKDLVGLDTSVETTALTEARQRQSELAPKGLGEEVGRAALGGGLQAAETLAVAGPVGMVNPLAGIAVAVALPTVQSILEKYSEKRLVKGLSRGEAVTDSVVYGMAVGMLERFGLKGLLEKGAGVAKRIGGAVVRGGAGETAESAFVMGYDKAVRGEDPEDVLKQLSLSAVGGAVGGAVIGGPLALQVKRGERNQAKASMMALKEGVDKGIMKIKPHEVGPLMRKLGEFKSEVKDPEFDAMVGELEKSLSVLAPPVEASAAPAPSPPKVKVAAPVAAAAASPVQLVVSAAPGEPTPPARMEERQATMMAKLAVVPEGLKPRVPPEVLQVPEVPEPAALVPRAPAVEPAPTTAPTTPEFFGPSTPWGLRPKDSTTFGAVLTSADSFSYAVNPDGSLPRAHESEGVDPEDVARVASGDMAAETVAQVPGAHGGYFLMMNSSLGPSGLPYAEAVRKVAKSKSPLKEQDLQVLSWAQGTKKGSPAEWVEVESEVQGGTLKVSPVGELWAVRDVADPRGEILVNTLYRRGGVLAPETKVLEPGKLGSRWVEGGKPLAQVSAEKVNQGDIGKGFLVDAWLGVNSVGGMLVHPRGRTVRTTFNRGADDFGGDVAVEQEALFQSFEGLTRDDVALGLDSLNAVSDVELKALAPDEASWSKLVDRRKWLNSKYGQPELYGADGRAERVAQGVFDSSLGLVRPAFTGLRRRVKLEKGKVEILSTTKSPDHRAVKTFLGTEFMKLVPRAKVLVSFDDAWGGTPMADKVLGLGSAVAFGDRTYVVHLNTTGRSPAESFATLSHELGHVLIKERLGALSEDQRAAVMGGSGSENFGEWAADQVSKWFVSEGAKPLGPAEKFFSGLAGDLKNLRLEPPGTFIDSFVRDLYPGPRLSVGTPEMKGDAKKFGVFARKVFGLHQNAKRNRGVPGILEYTELNSMFNGESMEWYSRATERIKAWVGLGKTEAGRVRDLLDSVNKLETWPSEEEFQKLVTESKVGPEGLGMYLSIRQDFEDALGDVEVKISGDIERSYTDPAVKMAEQQLFKERMEAYRARPYFPQSRFGEFIVVVKDARTQKTIRVESQESERDQKSAFRALQEDYPGPQYDLRMSKFTPAAQAAVGLPPGLVKHMAKNLDLDASQVQALEDISVKLSPSSGFKSKFLRRSGVVGYSQDAVRAYGDYFWRLGRGLARVKYVKPMQEAIAKATEAARGPGKDNTKAAEVASYMNDHYKELMDPTDDHPKLRGAISTWVFGAVPRTGILNLLQVPMVSYPHLAANFGDGKAAAALSGGYASLRALYTGRKSAFADQRMLKLVELAHARGITNESYAMELAGLATEGVLQHGMLGFGTHQKLRQMQSTLMFFMRESEQLNRRVVFRAAAGLALENSDSKYVQRTVDENKIQYGELIEKGLTPEEAGAFLTATDSVRSSMWEYAKYNRPKSFQGGKAVPLQFLSYTQNLLWFMRYAPGRGRALALHLMVGGLKAIPLLAIGAELFEKVFSRDEPERLQLDKELGKLVNEYTALPPDLVLHGLGFYGFGLGALPGMPSVNISPSFSMEQFPPGVQALTRPKIDVNEAMVEAMGISAAVTRDMFDVLGAEDANGIRLASMALPPALQNLRKAMDIATLGKALDNKGLPLATFDPAMPAAVARSFGMNLTEQSEVQEVLSLQYEQDQHITARKSKLTAAWLQARRTGDQEMLAGANRAIAQFNNDLQNPQRGIRGRDLREAYRGFIKAQVDREKLERRGQRAGTDREIREVFRPR